MFSKLLFRYAIIEVFSFFEIALLYFVYCLLIVESSDIGYRCLIVLLPKIS